LAINLLFFSTSEDFAAYVIQEIVGAKKTILSHMQRLNEASRRFDSSPKGDGRKKPKWGGSELPGNTKQQEVEGFKILVNPTPNYELSILDEAIKSAQDRLEVFERIEKHLLPGLKNHAKITAILEDELPIAFMYNEEH
jgi:hypothetical protein